MIWETILLAHRAILRNALRSSLTILGIIIGVAAVIVMVTLGGGATAKITADISSMGSNMLHVRPGQGFGGPGGARSDAPLFDEKDAAAIHAGIYGVAAVAPVSSQQVQAISGNQNWSTSVTGTTGAFLQVRAWALADGRSFTEGEQKAGATVCILGATVRKSLFGAENPIGGTVRLGKISFRIIGLLSEKGQSSFGSDQDDIVLIPLRALQRRLTGKTDVGVLLVSAKDEAGTEKVKSDIEQLMRERRRISGTKEDNFSVRDMKEIVSTLTSTTRVLTSLLSAVAAVSLLVGGIGIMNIMLVSVTERTREIGTRLAIGAREREVLLQFLVEAVVLACFGGICGIGLGLSASAVGAHFLGVPFIVNSGVIALAFLFSGAVGVIFGFFPARKAARLDPIEALRHE